MPTIYKLPIELRKPNWQNQRRAALLRDGYQCQDCGDSLTDRGAHVHHINGTTASAVDDLASLITLCPTCHCKRHPHRREPAAPRPVPRNAQPWQIDLAWLMKWRYNGYGGQALLARHLKVSRQTITNWLNGQRPSTRFTQAIRDLRETRQKH